MSHKFTEPTWRLSGTSSLFQPQNKSCWLKVQIFSVLFSLQLFTYFGMIVNLTWVKHKCWTVGFCDECHDRRALSRLSLRNEITTKILPFLSAFGNWFRVLDTPDLLSFNIINGFFVAEKLIFLNPLDSIRSRFLFLRLCCDWNCFRFFVPASFDRWIEFLFYVHELTHHLIVFCIASYIWVILVLEWIHR